MSWKKLAAGAGIDAFTKGLKSLEGQVSKRQYKRLLATAVAQVLALHPDLGRGAARRKARSVVGARPSKSLMGRKAAAAGLELAVAAGTAAVAKKIGEKVRAKVERDRDAKDRDAKDRDAHDLHGIGHARHDDGRDADHGHDAAVNPNA